MRDVILLRHATAAGGLRNDFDRHLTDDGKREAHLVGQQLAKAGLKPDRIVASPAVRARETASLAAQSLGVAAAAIVEEPAIYEADVQRLLEVVGRHDVPRLLLVGHDPGISHIVRLLVASQPRFALEKGHAAHLQLDGHQATLVKVYRPA